MAEKKVQMDEKDLKKLNEIQEEFDELTYDLGRTQLNIMQAREELENHKEEKDKIEEEMNDLRKKYQSVSRDLHKKYGPGVFDSETGELIERKDDID